MSKIDYFSFERVLEELQLEEDELKRLVSEGEIRAFRDEDRMKFKRSDIESLRRGRQTEPTIILPASEPADESESEVLLVDDDTSETLIDVDDLDELDSGNDSVDLPTVDFGRVDLDDSDTMTADIELDDPTAADTFVDDSSSAAATEPIDFLDESGDSPIAITRPVASPARRAVARRPAAPSSSPVFTGLLVASFVLLYYGAFVVLGLPSSRDTVPTLPATGVAGQLRPPAFADDPRVNPGATRDGQVSDQERLWYRDWRREPFDAARDRR